MPCPYTPFVKLSHQLNFWSPEVLLDKTKSSTSCLQIKHVFLSAEDCVDSFSWSEINWNEFPGSKAHWAERMVWNTGVQLGYLLVLEKELPFKMAQPQGRSANGTNLGTGFLINLMNCMWPARVRSELLCLSWRPRTSTAVCIVSLVNRSLPLLWWSQENNDILVRAGLGQQWSDVRFCQFDGLPDALRWIDGSQAASFVSGIIINPGRVWKQFNVWCASINSEVSKLTFWY